MVSAVVLAAGKGTRMRSQIPKVLHRLGDRAIIDYPLGRLQGLCEQIVVVLGHQWDKVKDYLTHRYRGLEFVVQKEQLGTAHAVMTAMGKVRGDKVLVLPGDMPLISRESLKKLIELSGDNHCVLLACVLEDPTGYGRLVTSGCEVEAIVEESEATPEERRIRLVNTGVYCFHRDVLEELLPLIKNDNAKGEYYLTDMVALMKERGYRCIYIEVPSHEGMGINSRKQLAEVYRVMGELRARRLMEKGVTVLDPNNTHIGEDVEVGEDTVIYPYTFIEGKTTIGRNCTIGPFCVVRDCQIGDGVTINSHCVLEGARLEDGVSVGPFARLRPETVLKRNSRVGNFVEVKKSVIGENSKANHLAYIGDATVGKDVNIGAGTITCNYDGVKKHPTIIEDGVFIGSDTQLVAPVKVGRGSLIGAGSTITKDVPPDSLAVTRAPMRVIEGKGMRYYKRKKYGIEE